MERDDESPDLDAMIGASTQRAPAAAGTALDDLATSIAEPPASSAPLGGEAPPADDIAKARRNHRATGQPRGRPRKAAAAPGAAPAPGAAEPPRGAGTRAELAAQIAELQATVAQISEENARLRARTGDESIRQLAQSFKMLTVVGFGIAAQYRGPHWQATDEEATTFADSLSVAAAPYAEQLQETLPWVAPFIALLAMVGKRVMQDAQLRGNELGLVQ